MGNITFMCMLGSVQTFCAQLNSAKCMHCYSCECMRLVSSHKHHHYTHARLVHTVHEVALLSWSMPHALPHSKLLHSGGAATLSPGYYVHMARLQGAEAAVG